MLIGVPCHHLEVVIAEGVGVVRDPFEGTYSTLRVVLRGLTFTTGIDRQRARRGAEPLIVVVILVVSEGQLRGQRLTILLIQEQRQEVELDDTVPVESFVVPVLLSFFRSSSGL